MLDARSPLWKKPPSLSRSPVHACNTIHIRAPRETIFATVRDLERWPRILPHYRSIRFLKRSGDRHVVEMAARRSAIPISWTSEFWTDEKHLELHFLHLQQWTRGMKVIWTMTPTRDGTRVEIVHTLAFRVRLLAWLAEPIIGGFFIHHVANKTLEGFKAYLENDGGQTATRES